MELNAPISTTSAAVEFLTDFFGAAPWPLAAFPAERQGPIVAATLTHTARRPDGAAKWVAEQERAGRNAYFAINPLKAPLGRKAKKDDVARATHLWTDLDPAKTASAAEIDTWRAARLAEFDAPPRGLPEPTWVIDSGRGFWLLWKLREPVELDGKDGETTRLIEAHGRAIEVAFAPWADACSNIDRIARLPGTINRKTGRRAVVLRHTDLAYSLGDFPAPASPHQERPDAVVDNDLAADIPAWLIAKLEVDDVADRSAHFHSVVTNLAEHGFSVEAIEAAVAGRLWAQKYNARLREEIERSAKKSRGLIPAATIAQIEKMIAAAATVTPAAPSAREYPIHALGDVLGPAAEAIAEKIQCSPPLAAQSVLAVASLAAQATADVRLPFGQTRPLSLFAVTVAESGDRKSSADNEAMAPVRMREERLREIDAGKRRTFEIDHAAWRAQRSQIERAKTNVVDRSRQLAELGPEPPAPLKPALTIGESTIEGLAKSWPQLQGALGIFSAEGGQFLGGHGFTADAKLRTAAGLSDLWDGKPVRRLRASDGLTDLRGRRLAVHLLVQPEAASDVLSDRVLRDQGFLSRLLLAAPDTIAGTRLWQEPGAGIEPALRRYCGRLLAVFEQPVAALNDAGNELIPRVLALDAEARAAWVRFYNDVEKRMKRGAPFAALRDVAGKMAEQAARIAGVLAIVDDPLAEEIDGDAMLRACDIAEFHLQEALILVSKANAPQEQGDADVLWAWFIEKNLTAAKAVDLHKSGPGPLRKKDRLEPAAAFLVADGRLAPMSGARGWTVVPGNRS